MNFVSGRANRLIVCKFISLDARIRLARKLQAWWQIIDL